MVLCRVQIEGLSDRQVLCLINNMSGAIILCSSCPMTSAIYNCCNLQVCPEFNVPCVWDHCSLIFEKPPVALDPIGSFKLKYNAMPAAGYLIIVKIV